MNALKRALGIIWMLIGPVLMVFMMMQAADKIAAAPDGPMKVNTILQWGIILVIFVPVSAGLVVFGYYAVKGEYDHLPEHNNEL